MTLEEISIKIRDHLTQQRAKSVSSPAPDEYQCAYRGEDGRMCAVGCLIDDEHYSPKLEGTGALTNDVMCAVKESIGRPIRERLGHLLQKWQMYHDFVCNTSQGVSHSYQRWIDGDESQSPAAFHDVLMELLK